ncbi:M4 family metallopeptidase [Nocardioides daejeonensis]|uniref:M4 family metallopeptidase n=1 Tax=Nocardioides daejeonensis TaxID=1046556 RepID=UPI000D742A76|nr:M4 family metallopeptidase [Nocardioides daejeonensis]
MRTTPVLAALALVSSSIGLAASISPAHAHPQADRPGAVALLGQHPGAARATEGQRFHTRSTLRDADGTRHVRLERTYRGLPVVGGDLVVHQAPAGALEGVSQTLKAPLDLAVRPLVKEGRAQRRGLSAKNQRGIDRAKAEGEPTLVVDATGARPRLAWQVLTSGVRADGTPSRLATYVDAREGGIIRSEEQIHTVEGQGQGLYSGTVPIQVTQSGGSYVLTDPVHGNGQTVDVQNKTDSVLCTLLGLMCATPKAYTSADTSFGNGSNSNRESAAVDAHYGAAQTWDYFAQVHGRQGIFGNGTGTLSRVHYGNKYVNAFWDGEKMTYGDGDGVNYGPLVSLDVAGHEMTHGVTEHTANLTYSGESGGLNEATSDIFGSLVEFHAANPADPADYFIGEQFDLVRHEGLRRMDDPAKDGNSHSCWSSSTKNVDVHYSSGVGNHFFYLLAEGSGTKTIGGRTHTSPTCDGSTIAGIGRDAAARIWFRALDVYMTSGTTYAQARTATLDAATDLFGASSPQRAAVAAAWSAVNVN